MAEPTHNPRCILALDLGTTTGWALRGHDGLITSGTAEPIPNDSLSPAAPWRVVNIGNSDKVKLLDFVTAIEDATNRQATRHYMDMQQGDVPATWADASLLRNLTGYAPQTDVKDGIAAFVAWYREYYGV